jgi:hypothetical protein
LDLTANPVLKIKAVSNNCGTTSPDSSTTCNAGVSTVLSGNVVQVTKLAKSSRVVIRIDYAIDCSQLSQCSSCAALTLNSYKVGSGSAVSLGLSVPFVRCSAIYNCDDGNACTTDVVSGSMCSRTCTYTKKV